MKNTYRLLATGLMAAAAMTSGSASAATVTIGTNNGSNCLPYSCSIYIGVGTQQQVYASSRFSAPVSINAISFFGDSSNDANDIADTASYSLSFYLTSRAVNGLSTDLASNRGTLLGNFGVFNVSGALPSVLTFNGLAFNYDPGLGNLLLQITPTSTGSNGTRGAYFQADGSGSVTSRALSGTASLADSTGLVTRFSVDAPIASAAPEPGTWAMMIVGFGLAGASLRRRRAVSTRVSFA